MQFTDLHIHSTYSDGSLTPGEIINVATQKNIKYISITDHDTIGSQYAIQRNLKQDKIYYIPGVELSTEYNGQEVHILGYFIDIYNEGLKKALDYIQECRTDRAKNIIENLNKVNINIAFDEINKDYDDVSIGRPHIAKLLVEKGFAANTKEAFHQYLTRGKPGFAERYKMSYKEALKLIMSTGGISVLAHPGELYRPLFIEEIVKDFKVYGLLGIEVFHPSHTKRQVNVYYNLAKKHHLLISGGSDCHGILINNDFLIGTSGINEELTYKFLKRKSL